MNNDNQKITTPMNVEGEFEDFDFEFVQKQKTGKIHDEKFQSKPTTFAKDAFKRFLKNKASVVGAVIIGVLMLGSIFSFLSPYDVSNVYADRVRMMPKIHEAGNGFWDGTIEYKNIVYDADEGKPIVENEDAEDKDATRSLNPDCILMDSVKVNPDVSYHNQPVPHGRGGYFRLVADQTIATGATKFYAYNNTTKKIKFDVSQADDLKLSITLGGEEGFDENKLAPLNIYLTGLEGNDWGGDESITPILLAENLKSPDGKDFVVNIDDISARMAAAGINKVYYAQIRMEFPAYEDKYSYVLIKDLSLSCAESSSDELKQRLSEVSFNNPNWLAKYTSPEKNPERYWRSNAVRLVYKVYTQSCSFLYDNYKDVFGMQNRFIIGLSIVKKYIENGWCTMSDFNDPSTFQLTHPDTLECPLRSIEEASVYDGVTQYTGHVIYYRYLGMDSVPMYIFGTDAKGRDLLTLALSCLKNSLLLSIVTSGVCMAIGLVWGSVSGYFGGNVDLIMERITDILSGVPWIVVMTLVMLSLGRTYITFGIAICLTGWIGTSSRTRTQFYRFKGREYVLASRTLGASDGRLIFRHILPNGLGTIVTGSVLMIPSNIFSEATLSYLGLGLQGTASFGVVLSENQMNLSSRPMLVIFPAIIVSLLMISFNLFGNGLRDALNPTLKGGEQ